MFPLKPQNGFKQFYVVAVVVFFYIVISLVLYRSSKQWKCLLVFIIDLDKNKIKSVIAGSCEKVEKVMAFEAATQEARSQKENPVSIWYELALSKHLAKFRIVL